MTNHPPRDNSDDAITVCKIGGSLFEWPELFPRLVELLAARSGRVVLIAGGGAAANVVREWDRRHGLGEARAHRLAIRALGVGEAFLNEGLPGSVVIASLEEAVHAWKAGRHPILNVEGWLARRQAAGAARLPASWEVTSDSIAAVVARSWDADLLLVKSTTPARAGADFVDSTFVRHAAGLHVKWCDLRSGMRGRWPT